MEGNEKQSLAKRFTSAVNITLLKAKLFYFFFYASVESLDPYLALYYKHTLLLSPRQIGILLGVRPCCLLISSPIIGTIADKLNRFRSILLLCLAAYLVTYTTVILVEPVEGFNCASKAAAQNLSHSNTSQTSNRPLNLSLHHQLRGRREVDEDVLVGDMNVGAAEMKDPWYATKFQVDVISKHRHAKFKKKRVVVAKGHYHGKLMNDLYFSWPFSLYDYKIAELFTWKLFIILLFITIIGELLAAPARTFADLYTIQALETNPHYFGRQLIPGVVGWAIVGAALRLAHHNKVIESSGFCEKGFVLNGKPYFFSFFFLMAAAIVVASFFKYRRYEQPGGLVKGCNECKFFSSLFKLVSDSRHLAFLLTVALCGVGDGMKSQFLHSYLSDLTGFKTIYPVALTIQFISQIVALAISPFLLARFKQPYIICFGLLFYGLTFSIYSFAENGWMVLAVEPLDGFTRKLTYVALVTYVGSPPRVGAALQGVVHGIYIGLGTSIGGFLGALCILKYGYFAVFISLGIAYLIFFGLHLGVMYVFPNDTSIGESFNEYEKLKEADDMDEFYELDAKEKGSDGSPF